LLISEVTLHIADYYIKHPVKFAAVPLGSVWQSSCVIFQSYNYSWFSSFPKLLWREVKLASDFHPMINFLQYQKWRQ
jgi:hypothetical protein